MSADTDLFSRPQPPVTEAPEVRVVEFAAAGAPWRVARFDLLQSEFGALTAAELPALYALAITPELKRAWFIARRLFGFMPQRPSLSADPEDLRVHTREELLASLGVSKSQLAAELEALRGAWLGSKAKPAASREETPPPAPPPVDLMRSHGMAEFNLKESESAWFPDRVADYAKVLEQPVSRQLARSMLFNELQIRRLETRLLAWAEGSDAKGYATVLNQRNDLEETYRQQLEQLQALCPWATHIAGKIAFAGVISEMVKGAQEYYALGDNRLLDGIFTATEIRVELRRHTHAPEPRYRAGLVAHLNAARAGLWDPNWKPQFRPAELKALEAGFQAAANAALDEAGVPLTNLESDDPIEGEYAALTPPKPEEVK